MRRAVDVIEIDGASNRGIEEIRTLRENVKYAPTRGRYKVYIIDEVHQLTEAAFNALLKTLEEPPPHVVFILATTDPREIPPTVLSRVQRFDFRPMAPEVLASTLERVPREEKIPFDPAALPPLVRAAWDRCATRCRFSTPPSPTATGAWTPIPRPGSWAPRHPRR